LKKLKAVFIGVDALDWCLVNQRYSHLNNLRQPLDWGYAAHCIPEIDYSPPSWITIYTGLPVETHRVRDVGHTELGKKGIMPWEMLHPYLWDYLNDAGYSCGVLNMPITWPAKRIDGWMVSGWPATRISMTPADLPLPDDYMLDAAAALVHEDFAQVEKWTKGPNWGLDLPPRELRDWIFRSEHKRVEALDVLPAVDVLFIGFTAVDRIGDLYGRWVEWRKDLMAAEAGEFFDQAHETMDAAIGELFARYEADVWVLVSDHGHAGGRTRYHTLDGIFCLWGTDVAKIRANCTNLEVAPSFLDALGVPLRDKPFEGASQIITLEDERAVMSQLEGLGYI